MACLDQSEARIQDRNFAYGQNVSKSKLSNNKVKDCMSQNQNLLLLVYLHIYFLGFTTTTTHHCTNVVSLTAGLTLHVKTDLQLT